MEKETKQAHTVSELEHFPFKTFGEYKKATIEGVASIAVDRGVALNWSYNGGQYASGWVRFKAITFMILPLVSAFGLVVYIFLTGSWWLLLALPVVVVLYFMFHPTAAMIFGPIRSFFVLLAFAGVVYSFFAVVPWLFALSLSLVFIWYGQKSAYANGIKHIIEAANTHEDLLCKLWQGKAMNIQFFNNDSYAVDHKRVGGEYEHYEK